jgi:hypothetical protein
MDLPHFFDTPSFYLWIALAFQALVAFLKEAFLEAVILWHLKWGSFLRSLLTALIVNLPTTILGFAVSMCAFTWQHLDESVFDFKGILLWCVFVAIEGGLLSLMNKKLLWKSLGASFIMNTSSYVLLYLLPLLLLFLRY